MAEITAICKISYMLSLPRGGCMINRTTRGFFDLPNNTLPLPAESREKHMVTKGNKVSSKTPSVSDFMRLHYHKELAIFPRQTPTARLMKREKTAAADKCDDPECRCEHEAQPLPASCIITDKNNRKATQTTT